MKKPIERYIPLKIEQKWQELWKASDIYNADLDRSKKKYYALTMLPYPSGNLHIGHWYAMTPSDARARYLRMRGFNVLFPMGFDAFGLPAENAAIKRNIHPKTWTYENIANMRRQFSSMGAMFDWRRVAISSDPEYYRWTQWFFKQFFNNDLAYRKYSPVDWCPQCNTTLAREQVVGDDRHCERCHTPVVKKELEQWFFRITRYAEELLNFNGIDWPESVKTLQTNWIGKSKGALVNFKTEYGDDLEVFTTRPDTLWGATFMVVAPEHPLLEKLAKPTHKKQVDEYRSVATRQTDIQREATDKEKTGVFTGSFALNPVNGEKIPIWVADYVLMTYGTGAIMAVPAHDQRDFDFARKYKLEIKPVIQPENTHEIIADEMEHAIPAFGKMINSGSLTGTSADDAYDKTIEYLESRGKGKAAVNYRLRDWLISRQRYWGAPIPIIHCSHCGDVAVPDDQLPVLLPEDVEWRPSGESPLKLHPTWRFTICPNCGGSAERETDTMDTFMCSSWYHLRYLSPKESSRPFDQDEYDYWMPVDTYTGGVEHATMHLIYTRFFHKACRDLGIVKGDEPMMQLRNQGQILGPDGQRMSKSRGNVVDPDEQVRLYGADTIRAFLMFGYRWEEGGPWDSGNITGVHRWLNRTWSTILEDAETKNNPEVEAELNRKLHQTIKNVTTDFENFEFNTIVSSLMELLNHMVDAKEKGVYGTKTWVEAVETYLKLLAPVAPHITEEVWQKLGKESSIHLTSWPEWDENALIVNSITYAVQINGKVRDRVTIGIDATDEQIKNAALAAPNVQKVVGEAKPQKIIVVRGRLVNIVQ